MKKIPALKLEIIHFNTEDIIVTSGGFSSPQGIQGIPISNNVWYATIGSELNDDSSAVLYNNGRNFKKNNIYALQIGESGGYIISNSSDNIKPDTTYAWYHKTAWYTGDLFADLESPLPDLGQFSSTYYYSN